MPALLNSCCSPPSMTNDNLLELIYSLQEKHSFLEDMVTSLNDVVTRQDAELRKLWDANRILKQQLNDVRTGVGPEGAYREPPPPHY